MSNIDHAVLNFIKRLSSETFMSIDKSKELVNIIFNNGYLEEAIDAYNEHGVSGLANYIYPQFYTEEKKEMKFELGKYYKHATGSKLYICGLGETHYYGRCFIGENEYGELTPVGSTEDNAVNYSEITKEQFIGEKIVISNKLVNCYDCGFKDENYDICNKYDVRIYKNLNNPKFDTENFYYPCPACRGRDFKTKETK